MKTLLLCASLLFAGCAGFTEHLSDTGKILAPKIGEVLAKVALNSAIQTLSGGEKADFLDSAAAGVRTSFNTEDVGAIVKIWTTPPNESTPPEMKAVAKKADEFAKSTGADTETMATALNIAAAKVRAEQ